MTLLLGIDIGTTSVKAGVFDAEGKCLDIVRQDYALQTPEVDYVELDAEIYWQATCKVVSDVLQHGAIDPYQVVGIGVSSQGETFIPVDAVGNPLHPAIVWLDNRAREEAQLLDRILGHTVYRHTGIPTINPTWTACKIAWLKNNRPRIYQSTAKFLLVQDFIVHRLTGRFVTEGSIACTSLLYNIVEHDWWQLALEAVGLEAERLPEISTPGAIAGALTERAAGEIGLSDGLPVVLGGMDQAAGAVGAGNVYPEIVSETTGGALTIQVTLPRPDVDSRERVPVYVHSIPERYLFVPVCDTGGMALKWFRDNFYVAEAENLADEVDIYDLMTGEAEDISPGSDGLLMLPHLTGAFSPEYNTYARGVFYGFTLYHRKAHFTRAVLESVAYMLRRNLEAIAQTGVTIKEVRATGGGAASRLWRQIKADVCQLPIVTLENSDTALVGDALLAGVAVGVFSTYDQAVEAMVHPADRLDPIPADVQVYEKMYQRYVQLNDVLEPLFKEHFSMLDDV